MPLPVGRAVDQCCDSDRHREHHHDRQRGVRVVDPQSSARIGQEIVQQQPGQHRRERSGGDSAEQCDDEHTHEEQRALPRDIEVPVQAEHRQSADGDRDKQRGQPGRGATASRRRLPCPRAMGLLVGDHVHVDRARLLDDRGADTFIEDSGPAGSPRGSDDELGGVVLPGEVEEGGGNIVSDHRVHGRADAVRQIPHLPHLWRGHPGEPVAAHKMDDHQFRTGLRGDPRGPANQRLGLGPTGHRDDHPLPSLPGCGDPVLGPVLHQGRIDLIGQPEQRQFP